MLMVNMQWQCRRITAKHSPKHVVDVKQAGQREHIFWQSQGDNVNALLFPWVQASNLGLNTLPCNSTFFFSAFP